MKRQIFFFLFLFTGFLAFGQDPVFTQFYAAPLQLNPAFTGTTYAPRFAMIYRNQLPSFAGNAYETYSASYDQFVPELNSGIGFFVMADDQGEGLIKTNLFKANYSYRVRVVDDFYLKFGVNAGLTQARYDWDSFVFFDQLDKLTGPVDASGNPNPTAEGRPEELNRTYFDVGSGLLAYSPHFYLGFSMGHLTRPNEGLLQINNELTEGLPLIMSLHAGTQITLKEGNNDKPGTFLSPNVLILKQGDFGQVNAGAYLGLGYFFIGSWYRHGFANPDAIMGLVGYQQGIIKVGYSYDFTVSELASANGGGTHEISLIVNLEKLPGVQRRLRARRYNDCFEMFR
ncbi:MAG: PorP/SprF family type IX secretion system membrane protein [Saprospiraceae bacterium]|nr:PorP/SprF family type IX secretion system membrane protein [Saprospiraceae bacterium]